MTLPRVDRRLTACLAALAALALAAGVVAGAGGASLGERSARTAATRFLDRYVDRSGRVVRRDQGGDTVSEGQAYAMLLSAATGDRKRFARVWGWTRRHLQMRDGLLSWHWQNGSVTGKGPASDADLDAARALLLASRRFGNSAYRRDALEIARSIMRLETAGAGGKRVLVAGPWGRAAPYTVDPSYFSPQAFSQLAVATGDRRWRELERSSWSVLRQSRGGLPPLPPDWAKVNPSGVARASGMPGGAAGLQYGFDAERVPVRMAESCHARSRRFAAAAWPFLRWAAAHGPASAYDLSGHPVKPGTHPMGLVAAAGAAHATGDGRAAASLLDRAQALDGEHPTYYGAAWVALGRVMLQTDWLGSC